MPVMIWREAMKVKMMGGMAMSMPIAMICPQSMLCSVMNSEMLTGMVRVLRLVSMSAEDKFVPSDAEGEDGGGGEPGLDERQDDEEEDLPGVGAIHARGFF